MGRALEWCEKHGAYMEFGPTYDCPECYLEKQMKPDDIVKAPEHPPVDKLVKAFVKIRDKRDALRKEAEEKENELEMQLDLIRSELLEICKETGTSSLKTAHGTVVRSVKTRYWSNDWEAMHDFIKENDALDLLEHRIHQSNMKQFLEEHPDKLPKGLNSDSSYEISVRRK